MEKCYSQKKNWVLNRKGKTFDWGNNDLSKLNVVDKQPKLIHSDVISELPSIETEDIYDRIIGPIPIGRKEKAPSYAERAANALKNAGLFTIDQARGVKKKKDGVIVIDNVDDDTKGNIV